MSRRLGARSTSATPAVGGASAAPEPGHDAGRQSTFRRRMASRRIGAAILASVVGSAGLASCASGNDALTNLARTTTNSVSSAVGSITLRNVYVAGPLSRGDSAQIVSAFFNAGTEPDTIIGVSSPLAAGGKVPSPAELPPGSGKIFIADGSAPTLQNVQKNLLIGSQVPVTITFARAGSIILDVPVEQPAPGASAAPGAVTGTPGAGQEPASPSAGATTAG